MPGSAGFFRNDADRPDPPFTRTSLQNFYVGGKPPPVLFLDGVKVSESERKKYRLFKATELIDYTFTWHHNIPWNILRRSWDVVVTFCTEESIRALFNFYLSEHPLADQGPDLLDKLLGVRKAEGIHLNRNKGCTKVHTKNCEEWTDHLETCMKNHDTFSYDNEEATALQTILCWGAWNLNEGPGIRVDDPGEFFDFFGAFDANEERRARYVAVERLNKTLNDIWDDYNDNLTVKPTLDTTRNPWSDDLMETMRVCEALTPSQREIVYFDPLMWAPVTLSAKAEDMFELDPKKTFTEDGMLIPDLQGKKVFKQMKKKVRWKA